MRVGKTTALLALLLLGLSGSVAMGEDQFWDIMNLPQMGPTGYVVPDRVLREMGLPREEMSPKENAAPTYIEAVRALADVPPKPGEKDDYGLSSDGQQKSAFEKALSGPWDPSRSKVDEWLAKTSKVRKLVRKAVGKEKCQFPVVAQRPKVSAVSLTETLTPWLHPLRTMAEIQILRGHLLEYKGRIRAALEEHFVTVRIGEQLGGQPSPSMLASRAGWAIQAMGQEAIHKCLQRHNVSQQGLHWLAGKLQKPDQLLPEQHAWVDYERVAALQLAGWPGTMELALEFEGKDMPAPLRDLLTSRVVRVLWPDRTLTGDFQEYFDAIERMCKKPPWKALQLEEKQYPKQGLKDWNVIAHAIEPRTKRALVAFARTRCSLEALRIEIGLRLFRKKTGGYPEELSALTPTYLSELPPDPFSGEPFHYRREGAGWVLYSVGRNRKDDGGDPSVGKERPGPKDIVFRAHIKGGSI